MRQQELDKLAVSSRRAAILSILGAVIVIASLATCAADIIQCFVAVRNELLTLWQPSNNSLN